jgi:ribosomal protein S18 acetylase RimI-like enzyme
MTGPLAGARDPEVTLSAELGDDFTGVFADAAFGRTADAAERLAALARMPARRAFAVLRQGGRPAAVGACAVEGAWAGIIGMRTAPDFRRLGLARRLLRSLAAFARDAGAIRGYLQVEAPNAPAIALYEAEGFTRQYLYHYWRKS